MYKNNLTTGTATPKRVRCHGAHRVHAPTTACRWCFVTTDGKDGTRTAGNARVSAARVED
jgi:hypothetical protein|tara:strand:+ start:6268 stop:6447 length:180 start_codon:yes stop_codon:yes gene_type:complete